MVAHPVPQHMLVAEGVPLSTSRVRSMMELRAHQRRSLGLVPDGSPGVLAARAHDYLAAASALHVLSMGQQRGRDVSLPAPATELPV